MGIILSIILGVFFIGSFILYAYIKISYKEFCIKETLKENVNVLMKRAYSSLEYINNTYNDPLNPTHNVLKKTLTAKITFVLDIIKTLPLETQEYELDFLIKILTETFLRINQDINDITKITSPLTTLTQRLAREKIDYLKSITV
jgi:hypothetical protein